MLRRHHSPIYDLFYSVKSHSLTESIKLEFSSYFFRDPLLCVFFVLFINLLHKPYTKVILNRAHTYTPLLPLMWCAGAISPPCALSLSHDRRGYRSAHIEMELAAQPTGIYWRMWTQ